jgi:hypothetical protein
MILGRVIRTFLTLLLLALPCVLLVPRLSAPVALPPRALEQLLTSRYTGANNRLGSPLVRPLDAARLTAYGDGALPDMSHGILYTGISAVAIKLLHETRGGQGQRATTLLGMVFLVLGGVLTLWLHQRWFPQRDSKLGALFFIWSSGALLATLLPGPGLLLALLGGLLCATLVSLDVTSSAQRSSLWLALAAGALWGLLFLTIYSALLLLPLLLWHVITTSRRDIRAILAFLGAAALFAAPQLLRATKFAHNPLYHSRWIELVMRTETHPGTALYHSGSLPHSVSSYLTTGGLSEVVTRTAHTLTELLPRAVGSIGFCLLLFVLSGLMRFTDQRLNRLRRLLFLLIPLHLFALSLFFPADECVSVLLLYAPAVAVLGAAFLQTTLHARRLPRLHARAALLFWSALCCGSGLTQLLTLRPGPAPARLYSFLGNSGLYLERLQATGEGILAADEPESMAFYSNLPVTLLPTSATDFQELETRLNKQVVGFSLTPNLRWTRPEDRALEAWGDAYRRVLGLFALSNNLPKKERDNLTSYIFYPDSLIGAIRDFLVTPIQESQQGGDYSALFWDTNYIRTIPRP